MAIFFAKIAFLPVWTNEYVDKNVSLDKESFFCGFYQKTETISPFMLAVQSEFFCYG
jgi:hypothetical protein